jgi:outer membrane lipoprotein SlyB
MKKQVSVLAALAVLSGSAFAQAVGVKAPTPMVAPASAPVAPVAAAPVATPAPAAVAAPAAAVAPAQVVASATAKAAALTQQQAILLCADCGVVQDVKMEKRKGKGGAVGVVGGAVVGGVLGNQVGDGSGQKAATVVGAVGGAVVGNEIQKRMNRKKIWTTTVKMKDGTLKSFEAQADPGFKAGDVVKTDGAGFKKL